MHPPLQQPRQKHQRNPTRRDLQTEPDQEHGASRLEWRGARVRITAPRHGAYLLRVGGADADGENVDACLDSFFQDFPALRRGEDGGVVLLLLAERRRDVVGKERNKYETKDEGKEGQTRMTGA